MVQFETGGRIGMALRVECRIRVCACAHTRGMKEEDVRALVQRHTRGRDLGFLGEPHVNVLELNLEMDSLRAAR